VPTSISSAQTEGLPIVFWPPWIEGTPDSAPISGMSSRWPGVVTTKRRFVLIVSSRATRVAFGGIKDDFRPAKRHFKLKADMSSLLGRQWHYG
jgi:hypothetical protein